jgi:steroid delta-isomerase-like uncharacterized protein
MTITRVPIDMAQALSPGQRQSLEYLYGALVTRDVDLLDQALTPDWEDIPLVPGQAAGAEGLKPIFRMLISAFPDLSVEVTEILAEAGRAAARVIVTGTHRGDLFGVPPSGKFVRFALHEFHEFEGDRLRRTHHTEDLFGLFTQIGAWPILQPGAGMMLALQIEGYSEQPLANLIEIPERSPGTGEVRVRVTAAALNPLDVKLSQGHMREWFPLTFPYIPGTDFAGIVDEVGESVDSFRNGDAVYGRAEPTSGGALAEFVTLPAELIARRPSGLDAAAAACLPTPAGVAHQALFAVLKRPLSAPLLILGTGAVARAACQLARGSGEVTVCGHGAGRLAGLGARAIDPSSPELAVIAANSAFVFDTAGGDLQAKVVGMLRPGAHVAAIVTPVPEAVAKARDIEADYVVLATKQATLDRLAQLAANSELSVEIAGSFTLEQAPATFRAFVAGTLPGKHVMQGDYK